MYSAREARRLVILLCRLAKMDFETAIVLSGDDALLWLNDALELEKILRTGDERDR